MRQLISSPKLATKPKRKTMKYFYENGMIYEIDLIEDGFTFRRDIEDLRLYRKENNIILIRRKEKGLAEILLNLNIEKEINIHGK